MDKMRIRDYFKMEAEKHINTLVNGLLQDECAAVARRLGDRDCVKYSCSEVCTARKYLAELIRRMSGNNSTIGEIVKAFVYAGVTANVAELDVDCDLQERGDLTSLIKAYKAEIPPPPKIAVVPIPKPPEDRDDALISAIAKTLHSLDEDRHGEMANRLTGVLRLFSSDVLK